jgi:hypothetical protein
LYLPIAERESIWNYHRISRDSPDAGWKLHLSATILNAPRVLARVAPYLVECGVQFKAPRSLMDVSTLNSGLFEDYTQVGKIITVYPRADDEAVQVALRLHELTRRFKAPAVPFDLRFCQGSNVYYRYGAFRRFEVKQADGQRVYGVTSKEGELIADERKTAKPDWVTDPFAAVKRRHSRRPRRANLLNSFHVLRALVQRGKGGVYQAIDAQPKQPRLCLLKEGRRHGEVSWDGRDGAWRVRHEARVLSELQKCGAPVPQVYSTFELDNNFYLVMEFVDGENLHSILLRQGRRLSIARVVSIGIELAGFLAQMHRAGWAWRDCKPKNLIVTREGRVIPIDFEGACEIRNPDRLRWGTPGFMPRGRRRDEATAVVNDDLFGLGSTLYLLLSGRIFDSENPVSISKLRRNVPPELLTVVERLLKPESLAKLTADAAHAQLNSILRKQAKSSRKSTDAQAA